MRSPLTSSPRWLTLAAAAMAVLTGCASGPPPQPAGPVPVITGPFGKDPSVTIPDASPSRQLLVRTLLPGSGPVVRRGDYVVFNVEGMVWADGRQIVDSFTGHTPQGLPLEDAMPAWRELAGQRVGSRVLLVIPPALGYGRAGNAPYVGKTDTVVFVIDILSALPRSAS